MNNADVLQEDDQTFVVVIIFSTVVSIFIPLLVLLTPGFILEGPLLVSLVILTAVLPGLFISLSDIRYFMANVLSLIFM